MRSLLGQWIVLMLIALLISHVLFFFIYRAEQARAVLELRRNEVLARALSVGNLVETVTPDLYDEILLAVNTGVVRFWLSENQNTDAGAWQSEARARLFESPRPPARSELVTDPALSWHGIEVTHVENKLPTQILDLKNWNGFGLMIKIRSDLWLNTVYAKPQGVSNPPWSYYLSLFITAVLLTLVAVLVGRKVGLPLQRLTQSADAFGRGESVPPVPEEGADDVKRTAIAFNRMQTRLRRFVEDRTRMVAAISHDLRTPITSMRLRAEFVEDQETREKFISALDEMQAMTEATLIFAREDATSEPTRVVDMNALIGSLCDDLRQLGWHIDYDDALHPRLPWRCRPNSLRRALRNVIENAVRYGQKASVRTELKGVQRELHIIIEDKGPGIQDVEMERVFDPFVRLEQSRSRETGGVGLGLSIARSIARSHGGDVLLENMGEEDDNGQKRGLRVVMILPGNLGVGVDGNGR